MRTTATGRGPMPRPDVLAAPGSAAIDRRRCLVMAAVAVAAASRLQPARASAGAPPLPAPLGPVVLSISGQVGRSNAPGGVDLDMAMLAALAQHSFFAHTPWYAQRRKFTGPLLRDVLQLVRVNGATLRLHALNDYRVEMPAADTQRFDVIVARLLDDQPMAVRDKGPLFIIYPFDDVPALRSATYYGRSAWQLRRIEVL